MAKDKKKSNANISQLWPVSILSNRFPHYQKVNPALLELFYAHKEKEQKSASRTYVSHDKLLAQYQHHSALNELAQFIKDSVFELASEVNAPYWQKGDSIEINMTGIWFQIANDYNFHETHVHGNCSWSGVYYVQSGQASKGPGDHKGKQPNGVTRFYGPNIDLSAGGHAEAGNLYLQDYALDSYPQDGKLVVFPSHLKHMVFPYNGSSDRLVSCANDQRKRRSVALCF